MGGFFNYDRDMMEPPEEREELDPSEYVYIGCGQWRYVGVQSLPLGFQLPVQAYALTSLSLFGYLMP